ncbi:MAG: winged helix-turn-helix domain-containing protein [Prevotella sp.]
MDNKTIQTAASTLWRLMSSNRKWSYQELKHESGLSDRMLNAAIGWLAHDGNIQIEEEMGTHKETYYQFFNTYY